jgi:serine/threonine protein phosphatase 1
MRTIVIGDIHSGLKALKDLVKQFSPSPEDRLIFLGDYVDGWSDAVSTVSYLIELSDTYNCIFIRGNHDQLTLEWLLGQHKREQWLMHGGQSTVDSYSQVEDKTLVAIHIDFFENLHNYFIDEQNRLFVHAGFTHIRGVHHENYPGMCYWDRSLWELALAIDGKLSKEDVNYPSRLKLYSEIYIGHTPVSRIGKSVPIQAENLWNMDTGAAFKGPLSAMDVDTKKLWQTQAVCLYYPDEAGRN